MRALRAHLFLVALFGGCMAAGVLIALLALGDDLSLGRRIAGGAIAGGGVALLISAPRLIG